MDSLQSTVSVCTHVSEVFLWSQRQRLMDFSVQTTEIELKTKSQSLEGLARKTYDHDRELLLRAPPKDWDAIARAGALRIQEAWNQSEGMQSSSLMLTSLMLSLTWVTEEPYPVFNQDKLGLRLARGAKSGTTSAFETVDSFGSAYFQW